MYNIILYRLERALKETSKRTSRTLNNWQNRGKIYLSPIKQVITTNAKLRKEKVLNKEQREKILETIKDPSVSKERKEAIIFHRLI